MTDRLDQTCPFCGITEARGGYCSKCLRLTRPEWVHPARRSPAQDAAIEATGAKRLKESRQHAA
jgi:hypothetical protein